MNSNAMMNAPELDTPTKGIKGLWRALKRKSKLLGVEYGYLLLAGGIPAVIMYFIYLSQGIHPFGDGSVLVLDLNGQYVYFYEAIRNWVYGDTSLLYSFSRALGGEFMGILAYYVASPFTFIVCLFPQSRILEALLTIFLLKTALLGITFGYYLHKTVPSLKKIPVIAFSILYALTSYAVVQQHNSMWIDAVIWLPILTLSIENLIKHGKYKSYIFFLALTLVSNYYIGYMVCIYTAAYFFAYYFGHDEHGLNNPTGERYHFIKSFARIGVYSVIAVGMAAVIIFTAYYSLQFGKNTFSNPNWTPSIKFDFIDLFAKLLPGSYDSVRPEGLPFVYCGVLTLILAPLYFISKKYSAREKITMGAMIALFVVSFSVSTIDLVWHGFQRPNWLNYRYSFMLCFILLVLAAKTFADIRQIGARPIFLSTCIIGIMVVILQALDIEFVDDMKTVWFAVICLGLYLILLSVYTKTKYVDNIALVLAVVISLEVFANGVLNVMGLDADVLYSGYSGYNNYMKEIRPIVEMVQENDKSFYRMEKTTFKKTNDNMALNIRGLSCSTSTLNKETIAFLHAMGYASQSHWAKYLGGTPISDSLMGIKYILSKDDLSAYYTKAYEANGYTAYFNPYALSIAFGVDGDIKDLGSIAVKEKESTEPGKSYMSPFQSINDFVTALVGADETVEIFVPVTLTDEKLTNVKKSPNGVYTKYATESVGLSAVVTHTYELPDHTGEYYFYLPGTYPREVSLSANGVNKGTFYGKETTRIVSLGSYHAGETLKVNMTLKNDQNNLFVRNGIPSLYYLDFEVFEEVMNKLAQMQFKINDDYKETQLCGTFTSLNDDQTVLTTIPYDEGWHVKVDGEEVDIYKTAAALVTFDIEDAGEHYVEIIYRPTAYVAGLLITIASTIVYILLWVLDGKLRRIPVVGAFIECRAPAKAVGADADFIPLAENTPQDKVANDGDDTAVSPKSTGELPDENDVSKNSDNPSTDE